MSKDKNKVIDGGGKSNRGLMIGVGIFIFLLILAGIGIYFMLESPTDDDIDPSSLKTSRRIGPLSDNPDFPELQRKIRDLETRVETFKKIGYDLRTIPDLIDLAMEDAVKKHEIKLSGISADGQTLTMPRIEGVSRIMFNNASQMHFGNGDNKVRLWHYHDANPPTLVVDTKGRGRNLVKAIGTNGW